MSLTLCTVALILCQAEPEKADALQQAARHLVKHLAAEEYDEVVKNFDSVMSRVLPAGKLQQAWEGQTRVLGEFRGVSGTRQEAVGEYQAVFATTEFEKGKFDTKVVFDSDGKVAGLFFVSVGQYSAPHYVAPDSFTESEVTIGTGIWKLPGTLAVPNSGEQHPAVVLVHGSGPHDRDETIGPNKPFRDLAQGLASRGVATLRYEKRTRHHQLAMGLLANRITVQEETIDDAVAAVVFLHERAEIDSRRIFVLGHSLGGNLLPRIAKAGQRVAGWISLAGSARRLEDLILEQVTYLKGLDGEVSETEKEQLKVLQEQVARVKSPDLTKETSTADLPLGVPAGYWLDLRGYLAAEASRGVERPFLILQGERDYQVTMEDFRLWQDALKERANVKFRSYPELNHLFMKGTGKSTPAEYSRPGNVAEAVVEDIADWVSVAR